MAIEKIEVRYSKISDVGVGIPQGGYYHKYIVYTDKNGKEFAARGGPDLAPKSRSIYSVSFWFIKSLLKGDIL